MTSDLLIVFARFPRPGFTKTRLSRPDVSPNPLTPQQACALYTAFLRDLFDHYRPLRHTDGRVMLGGAFPERVDSFRQLTGCPDWMRIELMPTHTSDLGQLMESCFERGFQQGYRRVILTGTDAPQLSKRHLDAAWQALDSVNLVLGPDNGGGLYLVGCTRPLGILSDGIEWSVGTDRQVMEHRCQVQQIPYALLPEEIDLDTTEDLKTWYALHNTTHPAAPRTLAWLRSWMKVCAGRI